MVLGTRCPSIPSVMAPFGSYCPALVITIDLRYSSYRLTKLQVAASRNTTSGTNLTDCRGGEREERTVTFRVSKDSSGIVKRSKSTVIREVTRRQCRATTTAKRWRMLADRQKRNEETEETENRMRFTGNKRLYESTTIFEAFARPLERRRFTETRRGEKEGGEGERRAQSFGRVSPQNEDFQRVPPFLCTILLLLMGAMRQFLIPCYL